jgi:preprotein translocase subunit SecA
MSIYQQWLDQANQEFTQEAYDAFWEEYLKKEQLNYQEILEAKNPSLKGSVSTLAERFNMDLPTFAGFLDGINTSLTEALEVETLTETSEIDAKIDWEALYFNMHKAKADWLYSLPQWDDILTQENRKAIKKAYNKTTIVINENKIGRNDPCPCGSGKKYKKCCLNK